jgi:DNA-binding GntR family transcriptional regulator
MVDVADWLRERILAGQYAPGEWIKQDTIAEACGTSRIPVRDALRLLEAEGLVTLQANAGTRVAEFNFVELSEVYSMRERIEPFAATLSVVQLTDEDLVILENLAAELDQATEANDMARWVEVDRTFHLHLLSRAPQRSLRIIDSLWNATHLYRRRYVALPSRLVTARHEHALLLEAVRSRSAEDAELLLQLHIRRTNRTLQQYGQPRDSPQMGRERARGSLEARHAAADTQLTSRDPTVA